MHSQGNFWHNMHLHRHGEQDQAKSTPPPIPFASKPRAMMAGQPEVTHVNPFVPISNDPPVVPTRPDHPVSTKAIRGRASDGRSLTPTPAIPFHTNKFYANFLLDDQSLPTWTHPYSLSWGRGRNNTQSWGMSVSLVEDNSIASGPSNDDGCCRYFFGPVGIQHMCLSADEFSECTTMTIDSLDQFSCNVNFSPSPDQNPLMTLPIVQGMGFVTAVYYGATPFVRSSVFFRNFSSAGTINNGHTEKYRTVLEDGTTWLVYRTFADDALRPNASPLALTSNTTISGQAGFQGHIQIAKLSNPEYESVYDSSAGAYVLYGSLSGIASGVDGRYSISWTKAGTPNPVLMFALPHHVSSFDTHTTACATSIQMRSITKGTMIGMLSDYWVLEEKLPVDMGFAPYSLARGSIMSLSDTTKQLINSVASQEIQQDVHAQCCLNSTYFSGKGLAKFAMIAYVLHDMTGRQDLALQTLEKLKSAFAVFVENRQECPLVFEEGWRGVVSTAGLNGDPGQDFGSSFYNDHHFHYGYFVYTAAVIGYLDPSWLRDARNKAWVDMLLRDFANPSMVDSYFPFSRAFDWYHGHSWAKGLFASGDGKDQESTSEDAFASYGIKMWGRVTGNKSLEASGDLRLAIQRRVFRDYFLMQSDNTVQPSNFIGNKVTGILFENKIDHATYFSGAIECIQGIHILPIAAPSALIRGPQFVREEWQTYFSDGRADQAGGGWRGVLYAGYSLAEPRIAYDFFARPDFDNGLIDGGASRTWYLAYTAALAGL